MSKTVKSFKVRKKGSLKEKLEVDKDWWEELVFWKIEEAKVS